MVRLSLNKVFAASALVLASVGSVAADLQVTSPSSSIWWVAQSQNLLEWSCQDTTIGNFTVLVTNTSPTIAVAPIAIIAIQNNFDCSILITQDQANQPAGSGWQILLANPLNNTDVYATSEAFEIKPLGSLYPSQVTSSAVGTASSTASGSAAPASSSTTTSSAMSIRGAGLGMGMLAAGVAAVAFA
ncbi:hypothetical protein HYPSUDRAFT_46499 [Hypholoma sublateritium FD-334 SS-4]|uniref:Uncharacterized protein n=1 Tax=Hypholoma sublateritium (strain FD-334 SS-4) TaxID=945553 RepID=A0A0D2KRX2_HYPSF|nr:hypothetical protein HYPSUDRAFT_46499 [Hypholoma sublateritium FD-334 SS-4]